MCLGFRSCKTLTALIFCVCLTVVFSAACRGDVTGKIKLDGKPPEMDEIDMSGNADCVKQHPDPVREQTLLVDDKGDIANVVVSIKKEPGQELKGELPKGPALLNQKGCIYEPHVVAMMVGQDLIVKNSDPFLHNVHSIADVNDRFNKSQPNVNDGEKMDPQPKAPEIFRVKCDVHPWMDAWVAVFDHPYFSVTGDDGNFAIKNLPDGTYTLEAWHEKLGTQTQKITVKDGKTEKPADFTFKLDK